MLLQRVWFLTLFGLKLGKVCTLSELGSGNGYIFKQMQLKGWLLLSYSVVRVVFQGFRLCVVFLCSSLYSQTSILSGKPDEMLMGVTWNDLTFHTAGWGT